MNAQLAIANPVARQNIERVSEQRPRLEAVNKNRYVPVDGELFMDRQVHWGPSGEKGVFHPKTNDFHLVTVYKSIRAGEFDLEKAKAKTVYVEPGKKTNVPYDARLGNAPSGGSSKQVSATNPRTIARNKRKQAAAAARRKK